jgi:hypothetical protein
MNLFLLSFADSSSHASLFANSAQEFVDEVPFLLSPKWSCRYKLPVDES